MVASAVKLLPNGDFRITLRKGESVLLVSPGVTPTIEPVATADKKNPFGLN